MSNELKLELYQMDLNELIEVKNHVNKLIEILELRKYLVNKLKK